MQHIETIELGSSQSSITFSSIPQDYDDLVLVTLGRSTDTGVATTGFVQFNGDTGSNYSQISLQGDGSSVSSGSSTSNRIGWTMARSDVTANTFTSVQLYISNYTASTNKSVSLEQAFENNATTAYTSIRANLWSDTSAINTILLSCAAGNLETGTIASLYGITAGGSGTVTTS